MSTCSVRRSGCQHGDHMVTSANTQAAADQDAQQSVMRAVPGTSGSNMSVLNA